MVIVDLLDAEFHMNTPLDLYHRAVYTTPRFFLLTGFVMKVVSSLKTIKSRDRNCQIVRRRGRLYVINKRNPRLKARQG